MDVHGSDVPRDDPAALLLEVESLRARTRRSGRSWWFPLTLFGVLLICAAPLYRVSFVPGDQSFDIPRFLWPLVSVFSGVFSDYPVLTALYWVAALTIGFVGSGLWYRREAQRIGLRRPVRAFVLTGLAITVGLVFLQSVPYAWYLLFWVSFRGTLGIAIIAVALLVLARLERSAGLTAVAVGFLALAVVVSTYNLENVVFPAGVIRGEWAGATAVVAPGLVLLVSGLVARRQAGRPAALR
jgi:hypothetical protein